MSAVSSLEKVQAVETSDTHIRGWKQAFTLIELLIVVLIIGILTAIAIPQYQTAVQKSRYATLMPLAKSVKNAEEAILMSNGQYSSKLEDLSITLPGTVDNNKVTNSDGTVLEVTATDSHNYVKAKKNDLNNYVMYFAKSTNFPEALKDNKVAKQVCLSYGPTSTTPITGTDSNYDTYILEGSGSGTGSGAASSGYNWDCSDGESCYAYDENGRTIATIYDCWDTNVTDFSTCGGATYNTYDANGRQISECSCYGPSASGTCDSCEESWTAGYDESGDQLYKWWGTSGGWIKVNTDNLTLVGESLMNPHTSYRMDCNVVVEDTCNSVWVDPYPWADNPDEGCIYDCEIKKDGTGTCNLRECV